MLNDRGRPARQCIGPRTQQSRLGLEHVQAAQRLSQSTFEQAREPGSIVVAWKQAPFVFQGVSEWHVRDVVQQRGHRSELLQFGRDHGIGVAQTGHQSMGDGTHPDRVIEKRVQRTRCRSRER